MTETPDQGHAETYGDVDDSDVVNRAGSESADQDAPAYDPSQRLVDPSKGTDEPPNTGTAESVDQAAEAEAPAEGPPAEAGELDMRDQDDRNEQDAQNAEAERAEADAE